MKIILNIVRFGSSLGAWLLLAAPAARAQDYGGQAAADLGAAMVDHVVSTATLNPNYKPNAGKTGTSTTGAARLAYVPTAALKASTVQGYVDRLKTKNPTAAQAVAASFGPGKNDYDQVYRTIIRGTGLRENDAADALTAYLVLGWMIVNNVQQASALPAGAARGVSAQLLPRLAANAQLTAPGAAAQLGEEMKLQFVILQAGWQSAIKEGQLPAYQQGIAGLFKNQNQFDMTQLRLTPQGFASKVSVSRTTGAAVVRPAAAAGATTATAPAAAPGSGAAGGAQWFFRALSDGGTGIAFRPVVLLASGDVFDIGDEPLETLNVAASKAAHPDAWGKWRKNGNAFVLTDSKGHVNPYVLGSGNWFPAYPAGAVPLKRAYERTSGGSIGAASALFISKIRFLDGTHFSQGENEGVSSGTAYGTTGSASASSGTYHLQGHTLTLTYAAGRAVRKSFALGATGAPAHPTNTLIFIGGDAYTDE